MTAEGSAHREFLRHFLPHEGLLRAYLRAAVRDPVEAEDLLQEVSAVLWEKFGTYDRQRPFRAWALGVSRFQVLKWKQKAARQRVVLSDESMELLAEAAAAAAETAEERRAHLRDCVEKLPEHLRDVLRLRYLEGQPVTRLAARARKSEAAVEMILVRTRRALRDCVDRRLQEANP